VKRYCSTELPDSPGWRVLLLGFAVVASAIDWDEGCKTRVTAIHDHGKYLSIRYFTSAKKPAAFTRLMEAAERLEILSRSTCALCGTVQGAKLRRFAKTARRMVLCPDCAKSGGS